MAKRLYTKVSPALWASRRFRDVEHLARLYYVYLLTNEHIDSTGCYRLPDAYACADFGVDAETQSRLATALVDIDMIAVDSVAEYVLIKRWFKHNPLTSIDHATGTERLIGEIESDTLRGQCSGDFEIAEAALLARLEKVAAEKAARALAAQMRAASVQAWHAHSGHPTNSLANTRFLNGGQR